MLGTGTPWVNAMWPITENTQKPAKNEVQQLAMQMNFASHTIFSS